MHRKPPADSPPGCVRDYGFGVEYGRGSDWGLGFGTDPELVAKYICTTEEFYEKNKQFDVGTKKMSYEEKKNLLLSLPDKKFIRK